jgi:hypothetical protein
MNRTAALDLDHELPHVAEQTGGVVSLVLCQANHAVDDAAEGAAHASQDDVDASLRSTNGDLQREGGREGEAGERERDRSTVRLLSLQWA